MLANNLRFLCSLNSQTSDGIDWIRILQKSIEDKMVKPGENEDDKLMKQVLTKVCMKSNEMKNL
jgi:inactivated superfamily I helicase